MDPAEAPSACSILDREQQTRATAPGAQNIRKRTFKFIQSQSAREREPTHYEGDRSHSDDFMTNFVRGQRSKPSLRISSYRIRRTWIGVGRVTSRRRKKEAHVEKWRRQVSVRFGAHRWSGTIGNSAVFQGAMSHQHHYSPKQ